ncbi:maker744 [Drosophila busckii]|uniref:Maker744 n=2 Tax=Drosophila busckii TaxID=30019 RepID=A0A0M4EQM8_DROBS|nr:maker744 [Drosophila busckii]
MKYTHCCNCALLIAVLLAAIGFLETAASNEHELNDNNVDVLIKKIEQLKAENNNLKHKIKQSNKLVESYDSIIADLKESNRDLRSANAETASDAKKIKLLFETYINILCSEKCDMEVKNQTELLTKPEIYFKYAKANKTNELQGELVKLQDQIKQDTKNVEVVKKLLQPKNSCVTHKPGEHEIEVPGLKPFKVLCADYRVMGPGWTMIQQRINGKEDFQRDWNAYRDGFGSFDGDFFLGLDKIHHITHSQRYLLYIYMQKFNNRESSAHYSNFRVGSEADQFELQSLGVYSWSGLKSDHLVEHMKFTTYDRDNDKLDTGNCAKDHRSGGNADRMRPHERMKFTTHDRDNDKWMFDNCASDHNSGGWWYTNCGVWEKNGLLDAYKHNMADLRESNNNEIAQTETNGKKIEQLCEKYIQNSEKCEMERRNQNESLTKQENCTQELIIKSNKINELQDQIIKIQDQKTNDEKKKFEEQKTKDEKQKLEEQKTKDEKKKLEEQKKKLEEQKTKDEKKKSKERVNCSPIGEQIIKVPGLQPSEGLCSGGHHWIVIQRRINGKEDFQRDWNTYRDGFGSSDGDFFLGLNKIHQKTHSQRHELYCYMETYDNTWYAARYDNFRVGSEADLFELQSLGEYTWTNINGDQLRVNEHMKFTTYDRDNDQWTDGNCANVIRSGGWWYTRFCGWCNLNAKYFPNEVYESKAIHWYAWNTLKKVQMLIRPI